MLLLIREQSLALWSLLFLGIGVLIANSRIMGPENAESMLDLVAEVSLIILLFLDAAQSDLKALKRDYILPQRMLLKLTPQTKHRQTMPLRQRVKNNEG